MAASASGAYSEATTAVGDTDQEYAWFFRDEYPRVVRTVYLILRDRGRAEEIAQEAFIQLFSRWKKVSGYDRPASWVRRVAIRLAVRALRRERMRSILERETRPPAEPQPVDMDLVRAVMSLSPAQRVAIVLHYYEDRPVAEIAEVLRCTTATAKVHLHRARKRLGATLGTDEEVGDVT